MKSHNTNLILIFNLIGGVMVCVLALSVVDWGFEPRSCQPKDYEIGNCCFTAKHETIRRQSKDWMTKNPDNVFD